MKTAIIIHGMPSREEYENSKNPSPAHGHWLPWIKKALLQKGIQAETPEMPIPYNPEYNAWKETFEKFPLDEETILIGHSCGGGFIVRYLSENNVHVGKVILVAPWIDVEKKLTTGMFDFSMDENIVSKAKGITVFISNDDKKPMHDTVDVLKKVKDITIVEFQNMGHFCYRNMKSDAFPELLEEALK